MAIGTRSKKSKSSRGVFSKLFETLESRTLFSVHTWTGAVSNLWSNPNNWQGASVPTDTENDLDVVFPSGPTRKNTVMDISGLTISDLHFTGNGYSINSSGGAGIKIDGSISSDLAGSLNRINVLTQMTASIVINTGDANTAADIQINGVINGAIHNDITKNGIGALYLTPAGIIGGNGYKGITTINAGTVVVSATLQSSFPFGATQPGDPDTARVIVADGASINIQRTSSVIPNISVQSLEIRGDGDGNGALFVTSNSTSYAAVGTLSGAITLIDDTTITVATGGSLSLTGTIAGNDDITKTGGGTLALTGSGSVTGNLNAAGIVELGGTYSSLDVHSTGTVIGNGTVNSISLVGATLNPSTGSSGSYTPGIINIDTDLTLDGNSHFTVNFAAGASFDKLVVSGDVDLGDAIFAGVLDGTFIPGANASFKIIDNLGGNAITGTFDGLAQGDEVTIGGRAFTISYIGGDGNDVVLTRTVHTSTTTLQVSDTNPVYGEPITLTATVTSAGSPTGTVNFFAGGVNIGSKPLENGTASITVSSLTVGTNQITVGYTGDNDNSIDDSPATAVTVAKAGISISMTAQDLVGVNKPMTVNVAVSIDSPSLLTVSNLAGLQIKIKDNGVTISTITLGAQGTGSTTISLDNLTNPHPITAEFDGDANFDTDASLATNVTADDDTIFAVATGPGGKTFVKVYDDLGNVRFNFQPFTIKYTGGAQVTTADVNGDGIKDIIVASSSGLVPIVKVFSGATGNLPALDTPNLLMSFNPNFSTASYKGGLYVAAGDTNGDGKAEIVVTPKSGNGAQYRLFSINGSNATLLHADKPYSAKYSGGAHVAMGDVDGDTLADIIVAPGNSSFKSVKTYSGLDYSLISEVTPYTNTKSKPVGFSKGIFVAAGDVDGDGKADIIVSQGAGTKAVVKILDAVAALADTVTVQQAPFQPYANSFSGGIRVATADIDNDGHADIIVAPGAGGKSKVFVYDGTDVTTPTLLLSSPITAFTISQTNQKPFNGALFVG